MNKTVCIRPAFIVKTLLSVGSGFVPGMVMISFLFSLFVGASAHAVDIKIGYVDLRKALQETSTGKKAQKDLKKEYDAKKEDLEKKEKDLKTMNDDLDKKKMVLSDEVKSKKQIELQQEMAKFQQQVQQTQASLQKKERDLTQPILEKLQEILDKKAKSESYTMIFEKSEQSVLWARKDLDLTDEVVKAYEKSLGK